MYVASAVADVVESKVTVYLKCKTGFEDVKTKTVQDTQYDGYNALSVVECLKLVTVIFYERY